LFLLVLLFHVGDLRAFENAHEVVEAPVVEHLALLLRRKVARLRLIGRWGCG
jgi:hypothetical protein